MASQVPPSNKPTFIIPDQFPANPEEGNVYRDIKGVVYVYDGVRWREQLQSFFEVDDVLENSAMQVEIKLRKSFIEGESM